MRIVIDLQGAQGQSRNRGIGRYTLSLVRALIRANKQHQLLLAINGAFPDSAQELRQEFSRYLPTNDIHTWFAPGPVSFINQQHDACREVSTHLYEAFISSLKPDCLLVTSLFEGLGDDALTSISSRDKPYSVAVVLYDLIPMLHRSPYLDNPVHARWYDEKTVQLRRADRLLAISESSRQEAIEHLAFTDDKVINISSAIDDFFKPVSVAQERESRLRAHYNLNRPFILYTGGIDHRKNIEGLIKAFSLLPVALRDRYQLAVVCSVTEQDRNRLLHEAERAGLPEQAFVMTGYVPEQDLLELYNLCELFVFPSLHEGFGLPCLEAMACGAAVIASDRTSLPEVVGNHNALFDPTSPREISRAIERYLTDDSRLDGLKRHGLQQARKFSWAITAQRALSALEQMEPPKRIKRSDKPRLAFVSPLPPQRSGISDYSAMLLPELAQYYTIDLINDEPEQTVTFVGNDFTTRPVEWLIQHADEYDRVLYQFGNSAFHSHMFELLDTVPGVVVLHDFYLSGVIAHREYVEQLNHSWATALHLSHGYQALAERVHAKNPADVIWKYPCNLAVLQQALNVIVHAPCSIRMAQQWYGHAAAYPWRTIPLVRIPAETGPEAKRKAREALGISPDAFVICSFGFIGRSKLNHRLLDAWLNSVLASRANAYLVFVGENEPGEYGATLAKKIDGSSACGRINITGWTDADDYRRYLDAADVGVQLRTLSRGETSAAVLDCMNHGLATIVNANGSMADLDANAVVMLPDVFENEQLTHALERLADDEQYRHHMGKTASAQIHSRHAPQQCADLYREAIEDAYASAHGNVGYLADVLAGTEHVIHASEDERCTIAACIDASIKEPIRPPALLLDITALVQKSDTSQTNLTAHLAERWLHNPPGPYRFEPVYMTESGEIKYAAAFALRLLSCPDDILRDEPVSLRSGDIWLGLELPDAHHERMAPHYQSCSAMGVHVATASTAELPDDATTKVEALEQLLRSDTSDALQILVDVSELALRDAGTGIQRVVRNILQQWEQSPPSGWCVRSVVADTAIEGYKRFDTGMQLRQLGFPTGLLPEKPLVTRPGDIFLGLDLQPAVVERQQSVYRHWREQGVWTAFVVYDLLCLNYPQYFLPGAEESFTAWLDVVAEADQLIAISRTVASQLESRLARQSHCPVISWFHLGADLDPDTKRSAAPATHTQPAAALEFLMVGTLEPRKGHDQVLAAFERLWQNGADVSLVLAGKQGWMVDELAQRITDHPELGRRLFWHQSPSDMQLRRLYQNAHCLIAASFDEGFGLPLIEASREGLHVMARNIPVFKEVAAENATLFDANSPAELASAIEHWLTAYNQGSLPPPGEIPWQTWEQSARQLMDRLRLNGMVASKNRQLH